MIILQLNIIFILINIRLSGKLVDVIKIFSVLSLCDIMIAAVYKKNYQFIKQKICTRYKLQGKGKDELKEIESLRNFIKQYTLIYKKILTI